MRTPVEVDLHAAAKLVDVVGLIVADRGAALLNRRIIRQNVFFAQTKLHRFGQIVVQKEPHAVKQLVVVLAVSSIRPITERWLIVKIRERTIRADVGINSRRH